MLHRIAKVIAQASVVGIAAATLATIPAEAAATAETPCSARAKVCIQIHTNTSWLMNNGKVTYGPVPISTGGVDTPTPPGTYKVLRKKEEHWSNEYQAWMFYSVFFTYRGHALHEGDLDTPSHGCVRLDYYDAVEYFNKLKVGDRVEVVR